jgi:uncharacterized protein
VSKDQLDYQELVQEALRGVVRMALQRVQREGRLPGAHHFYLTFQTTHPGVKISEAIRNRYPEEMTIVLQHQFWDLKADEEAFQITLSFSGKPEKLEIPYQALKSFFDPSTRFGLQFTPAAQDAPPPSEAPDPTPELDVKTEKPHKPGEVVSLDQFRKK